MAKVKTSVTIAPELLERAKRLTGNDNVSELIDHGLSLLIDHELERQWTAGYLLYPQNEEELAWAEAAETSPIDDDTDWEALYLADIAKDGAA